MNTEALQTDINDMMSNLAAIKGEPFARIALLWMKVPAVIALVKGVGSGKVPTEIAVTALEILFSDFAAELAVVHGIDADEMAKWASTIGAKARQHLKR